MFDDSSDPNPARSFNKETLTVRWIGERQVRASRCELRVASGPDNGPPLLCIHGVGRTWHDFVPLLPAFVPCWQLVAIDLPGHGGSDRNGGRYLVRDYLVECAALLARFARPVVIYGHSLGALLAGALAAECPERVRAIIAEDPPSPAFLDRIDATAYGPLFRGMQRLAGTSRDVAAVARALGEVVVGCGPEGRPIRFREVRDAASIRFSARWLCDLDPAVYTPVVERRWLEGLDFPAIWSGVRCPALLLAADERAGGMLPADDAREILANLRDGTLAEFPQVGHQIHWMAREATLKFVLQFLETL